MKKIKRKITIIFIFTILILTNIVSAETAYVNSLTENLKTNYIKDKSEIICCYYDLNNIGTDKISLKFKAIKETNKTNGKSNKYYNPY